MDIPNVNMQKNWCASLTPVSYTHLRCEQSPVAGEMGRCSKKSECLAEEYQKCSEENCCDFMDAAPFCTMNEIDFMHLDAKSHDRFSAEIEKIVRRQV